MFDSIKILKNKIDLVDISQVHKFIEETVSSKQKHFIGNLNIHAANISYEKSWFRNLLNDCPIVFCDGKGIQLGAWILGKPIPEQITYHTWMWELLMFCDESKYSLYFLGSMPGVAEEAITRIQKEYSSLSLESFHGYCRLSLRDVVLPI